jgi:hypothetical protein
MKTLLLIIALLFSVGLKAQTQTAEKIEIDKTIKDKHYGWYTVSDREYPVYQGLKGGLYLIRTSGKTGEKYRQYIDKEKQTKIVKG